MRYLGITFTALLIIAVSLFIGTSISYSSSNDDNHLSSNDSVYSPPGYMNKDIQQARTLTDKYLANKDKADNKTEATQREVSQKVQVQAVEKPKAELKQKQSSKSTSTKAQTAAAANANNINIGTGINQEKDASGRVISEVIDGQRYVYAGFSNVGKATIADAIAAANAGDKVIVKAGAYAENLYMTNGVSIYGGYKENGLRDTLSSPTTIEGSIYAANISNRAEIDGFVISSVDGILARAANLEIRNNIFNVTDVGVSVEGGSTVLMTGNSFNTGFAGIAAWGGVDLLSTISSVGNNFTGPYGINRYGVDSVSSVNDYFKYSIGKDLTISINNAAEAPIIFKPNTSGIVLADSVMIALPYAYAYNDLSKNAYDLSLLSLSSGIAQKAGTNDAGTNLRDLLIRKNSLSQSEGTNAYSEILNKSAKGNILESAIAIPARDIDVSDMDVTLRLANILKNPTEDQKVMLNAIKALLGDTSKIQEGADKAKSEELKKATDDILNAVANILLAQAMPDLIKKGDMANIKAIFQELDTQRNKIMLDYSIATKPYYENMIKDMAKNMPMLQLKSILSGNVTKNDLEKLPPSELDKILEKIKNMKSRSFEEEYILQQEAKYRKEYLEPNNKKLESDMKGILNSFTGRINDVLKSADKK